MNHLQRKSNTGKFPLNIGDEVEIIGWEERYYGMRFTVADKRTYDRGRGEYAVGVSPTPEDIVKLVEMAEHDWLDFLIEDGKCWWWEGFLYNYGPAILENE